MRGHRTSSAAFERQKRISNILNKRLSGQGLAEIAAAENCTIQNISQLIQRALGEIPKQSVADIRLLEASRLDAMQNALWPQCLLGDIAAIDRVIQIMRRRAQMLGLDKQPDGYYYGREDGETDQVVRVEIIGSPEPQRLRWLEDERRRLMEASLAGDTPTTTTIN